MNESDSSKLDSCLRKLEEIRMWTAVHAETHKGITEDLADFKETLYGNGTPGVKETLRSVKQKCDETNCSGWWSWAKPVTQQIVAWGVIIVISLVALLIIMHWSGISPALGE